MSDDLASPERQKALAMPRRLSKYLATKMIPGVVLKPMPRPVKSPKVRKSVSTLGAKLLLAMPMKHKIDPAKVTVRQLNR